MKAHSMVLGWCVAGLLAACLLPDEVSVTGGQGRGDISARGERGSVDTEETWAAAGAAWKVGRLSSGDSPMRAYQREAAAQAHLEALRAEAVQGVRLPLGPPEEESFVESTGGQVTLGTALVGFLGAAAAWLRRRARRRRAAACEPEEAEEDLEGLERRVHALEDRPRGAGPA